jgi:uncharacterized protein YrrD
LLGLSVIAIAEGKRLGQINTLLVRPEDRSVTAFGIGGGAFSQTCYLPIAQIRTIGVDAVMVESEAVLQNALPPEEVRALDAGLPGRSVITESGQKLGEITGFAIHVVSGKIEIYHVRTETGALARLAALVKRDTTDIPDALVVALGGDALVVREEALALGEPEATEAAAPDTAV